MSDEQDIGPEDVAPMPRAKELPASFLRVIGTPQVHGLNLEDPTQTECGITLEDKDLEGWADYPPGEVPCPACAAIIASQALEDKT